MNFKYNEEKGIRPSPKKNENQLSKHPSHVHTHRWLVRRNDWNTLTHKNIEECSVTVQNIKRVSSISGLIWKCESNANDEFRYTSMPLKCTVEFDYFFCQQPGGYYLYQVRALQDSQVDPMLFLAYHQ